ncbi:MAG: hypothetical protein WDW36_006242 [Sanguina aurantia]
MLYNSLLDEKVPFFPSAGPHSRQVTWYTCGPTVYDSSHMGHARTYVTFDIARRVLEDYFGYNVSFVMNVTDVDDKIIMRARRNYLLAQYISSGKSLQESTSTAAASSNSTPSAAAAADSHSHAEPATGSSSSASAQEKSRSAAQGRKAAELETQAQGEAFKLERIHTARVKLAALKAETPSGTASSSSSSSTPPVIEIAGDFMADLLDQRLGSGVVEPSIYRAHAAKFEAEFFDDMDALGCRRPDVTTRVSEYMDEIVSYVSGIITNGMAYEANGSVYFDTNSFRACGHTYAKLKPWAVGNAALASEGEANFETREKRGPADFALWKAAKPGEPSWDSPWGRGRPGWHIECSAMASSILGPKIDIHSGGEDLKFPHHDNELAQAEAFYHNHEGGCQQWVNYFLHAGHLSIEGLKMSKSLKNFISIKDALKTYTPRQLRLMMALQPWFRPMVYGDSARTEMRAKEAMLKNFFQNVGVAVRDAPAGASAKWQTEEMLLNDKIQSTQAAVHAALLDSINTAGALDAVSDLIKAVNKYLSTKEALLASAAHSASASPTATAAAAAAAGSSQPVAHSNGDGASPAAAQQQQQQQPVSPVQPLLLKKASAFVTRVLSVMGIVDGPTDRLGFSDHAAESTSGSGASPSAPGGTAHLTAILNAFSGFRDEVRGLGKGKVVDGKEVMLACDSVRDKVLPELGVRLEDRSDGKAIWKLDDPEVLREEAVERARAAAEASRKKLASARDLKAKELEKLAKLAALPGVQTAMGDKYSRFDAVSGLPTHDKDGAALEGKAADKAAKEHEKALKVREPLARRLAEEPQALELLAAEVEALTAQLAALATQQ